MLNNLFSLQINKLMSIEIERKFLLKSDAFIALAHKSEKIIQAYLSSVPERTVRVRIKGKKSFLTIKGSTNTSGLSRYEFEKEISLEEAKELLLICEKEEIEKVRYYVNYKHHLFEIDIFENKLKGLILAEIEIKYEDEFFEKPDWLGQEVTGNLIYYNSNLSKLKQWKAV